MRHLSVEIFIGQPCFLILKRSRFDKYHSNKIEKNWVNTGTLFYVFFFFFTTFELCYYPGSLSLKPLCVDDINLPRISAASVAPILNNTLFYSSGWAVKSETFSRSELHILDGTSAIILIWTQVHVFLLSTSQKKIWKKLKQVFSQNIYTQLVIETNFLSFRFFFFSIYI